MSVIMKIYRSNLVNDILMAVSFQEVKTRIQENIEKLKAQKVPDNDIDKFIAITLTDLKDLNQSALGYDQYANIITAKVFLEEIKSTSLSPAS
jgi:elongation factor P--beta-lysine ligase